MDGKSSENFPQFALYSEYKPRLSVVQITVSLSRKSRLNTNFAVRKNGISIEHAKDQASTVVVFEGLRLFPPSTHNMQWVREDELQMRVQAQKYVSGAKIRNRERVLSGDFGEAADQVEEKKFKEEPPIIKNKDTLAYCSACGQDIIRSKKFNRVLPLPSGNWQELTDSWFCCQHSTTSDSMQKMNQPLVPKPDDFLYTDTTMVVLQTALCPASTTHSHNGTITCSRCCYLIGRLARSENGTIPEKTPVILYKHQVNLQQKPFVDKSVISKEIRSEKLEKDVAHILTKYAEQQNCFRFVLEARDDKNILQPCLLIWLMDAENVIFQDTVSVGLNEPHLIKPVAVSKVIYKDCFKEVSLAEQWRKDLGAHCLELPEEQCYSLLQLLMSRTEQLPVCLRVANEFLVSYLETGQECFL